jgi:hypothetical protein
MSYADLETSSRPDAQTASMERRPAMGVSDLHITIWLEGGGGEWMQAPK